ncbi:MAG TPA: VanZ family protein [Kiritimatiellia bacterium]|nr:VanZ family protein [Kiritimatiellia bacterium]HNS81552.1 VanZ family protein [Kiritimatiellia bacterium]HQQ04721.1 VanZ family protein [Kiritimatiellia bacterium]
MGRLFSLWLPPAAWAGLIFGLSSWSGPERPPPLWFPGLDKLAHAVLFGVLGLLLFRAFASSRGMHRAVILAAAVTALYGATDEWHQSFNAARSVELMDFVADCAGGIAGALAGCALAARWHQRGRLS